MTSAPLAENITAQLEQIQAQLPQQAARDLSACVSQWLTRDLYVHHETVPEVHVKTADNLPASVASQFHRAVLLRLCQHTLSRPPTAALHTLQLEELHRIVEDCGNQPDAYFELGRPRKPLEKDLSLSARRSLPIGGAWMVEQRCIPLARSAAGLVPEAAASQKFVARVRKSKRMQILRHWLGRQPICFVVHTLERRIRHFNSAQHELAMRNLAAHLATTDLPGVYRESWFLDPRVSELTPKLAFLRDLPDANGARFAFRQAADAETLTNALHRSPPRKAAYEAGEYSPAVHAYLWPRTAILSWADLN